MSKISIKLIDKVDAEKFLKEIKPQIIFNRLDIKFEEDYELLEIIYNSQKHYITFHLEPTYCQLGLYMIDIDKKVFKEIIKFIYKTFKINNFYAVQSLNGNSQLNKTIHWTLNLPDTQEEFDRQFSSRTRYNRKIKRKNLEKDFDCEFIHLSKSGLTEDVFENFLNLKRQSYDKAYENSIPKDFLSDFHSITDAYLLKINKNIEACVFYSSINNNETYQVNIAYNTSFSKYGIGVMLYYHAIEDLIKKGFKKVYLGGGNYDYKKNSKAVKSDTYEGFFTYTPLLKRFFSCKNLTNTKDYSEYYKKIKIDKKIKELAKKYKNKKIVIYGAGQMSKILFENYDLSGLNIKYICDRSFEERKNEKFYGYSCIPPSDLEKKDYDVILVLLLKASEVVKSLEKNHLLNNKIITSFLN